MALNIPKYHISKDKDGYTHIESLTESKRRNPSPEEKRWDTGEKDFTHRHKIFSKDRNSISENIFSRKGNTQTDKVRETHKFNKRGWLGGNETGSSSWKEDIKVVESGGKFKGKFGNWHSKRHYITGSQESRHKSILTKK